MFIRFVKKKLYMKKIVSLLVCFIMILGLSGCGGNIKNVKTKVVESDIYSTEDIDAAIKTVMTEFSSEDWKGCKLTEIYYVGDESLSHQEWADRNDADEVIVLLTSFDVGVSAPIGLNPNSTYSDYSWILVRDTGGQWKCVDGGY